MNRFIAWWRGGYNNDFKLQKRSHHSVSLGGKISLSFLQYMKKPVEKIEEGRKNTSENGSIMRNATIPINFNNYLIKAFENANGQSLNTHKRIHARNT